MKQITIEALSDIHIHRYNENAAREAAWGIIQRRPDVLALAGDVSPNIDIYKRFLSFFDGYKGKRIAVPGNHCIWVDTDSGESSLDKIATLQQLYQDYGFTMLDNGPVEHEGVGFVGTMGWYDYSFKRKDAPGEGITVVTEASENEKRWEELTDADYSLKKATIFTPYQIMQTGWMDGERVALKDTENGVVYTDKEFTADLTEILRYHIRQIEPSVRTIVAVTHHVPFERMVRRSGEPDYDYCNAYTGSTQLGKVLLDEAKIRYLISGHTHAPCRFEQWSNRRETPILCHNICFEKDNTSLKLKV